ncbi:MAG: anti-sigma factor [Devosia sp.]|uniref:anti-sigma factor family protein n=1 Tax=Devosia sp. TaxID=1871048 RepID=UPI0024CC05CE|nr:anti-sigma factor [Devosia sp.]UYN98590.1 MAG: anti-sigma factor [Devosia sp.]
MMHSRESIDPLELAAYVDNQLDAARRIEIERWLSQHPDVAAQVMTDLQFRDELRFSADSLQVEARQPTEDLARRLDGRLRRNRVLRHLRPLVAASLLVTAGWVAHGQIGGALPTQASTDLPEYVSAAVDAHHITALRAGMHSQTRGTEYDPAELLAETAIRMPALPAGWTITDVQIYPSDFGPSVELAFDADGLGAVSLFAARPGRSLIERPSTRHVEDTTTAYWQIGDIAYALVAGAPTMDVSRAATSLFDSLD